MKKLILVILATTLTFLLANCGSSDANAQKDTQTQDSTAVQDSAGAQNPKNADGKGKNGGKEGDPQQPEINAVPVEVTALTTGNISNFLLYSSTLETEQLVDAASAVWWWMCMWKKATG